MDKKTMFKVVVVFGIGMLCALLIRGILLYSKKEEVRQPINGEVPEELPEIPRYSGRIVVVDAGHGGNDPGKVGVNGSLEKDINLEIALLLKEVLEEEGITVVLTRHNDSGLYDENSDNKKMQDMRGRLAIIEESRADLVVSIHQNSFGDTTVKGPQVFYYETSEKGRVAAEYIQNILNEQLEIERPRVQKGNDNYFLLTRCAATMVIAECGFLSNPEEEALLLKEDYQERIANAIAEGIYQFFDKLMEEKAPENSMVEPLA